MYNKAGVSLWFVCRYVIASVAKACRVEIDDVCDVKYYSEPVVYPRIMRVICVSWWFGRLIGLLKQVKVGWM